MKKIKILTVLLTISLFSVYSFDAKSQDMVSKEVVYKSDVKGSACATKVSEALQQEKGVESTSVNLENKTIKVKYNPDATSKANIQKAIEGAGYTADETTVYQGKAKACCSDKKTDKKGSCGK